MQLKLNAADLNAVMKAASDDKLRPYIAGVLIERISAERVRLVATNGHFLFAQEIDAQEMAPDWPARVRVTTPKNKALPVKNGYASVTLDLAAGIIRDAQGTPQAGIVQIDGADECGPFPQWRNVIPTGELKRVPYVSANPEYVATVAAFLDLIATPDFYAVDGACDQPMVAVGPDRMAVLMPLRRVEAAPDTIKVDRPAEPAQP